MGEDEGKTDMVENQEENLKNSLHSVEKAKCDSAYEQGTLLSPNGLIIREYHGETHSISIDEAERPLFKGNVFTHNHPSGRTFTVKDINSFVNDELYEARTITPQGTYFSIKRGTGEVNCSIGRVMQEEKVGSYVEAAKKLQAQIIENDLDLSGADYETKLFDIMSEDVDNWLTENAADFGCIYTKGEI